MPPAHKVVTLAPFYAVFSEKKSKKADFFYKKPFFLKFLFFFQKITSYLLNREKKFV